MVLMITILWAWRAEEKFSDVECCYEVCDSIEHVFGITWQLPVSTHNDSAIKEMHPVATRQTSLDCRLLRQHPECVFWKTVMGGFESSHALALDLSPGPSLLCHSTKMDHPCLRPHRWGSSKECGPSGRLVGEVAAVLVRWFQICGNLILPSKSGSLVVTWDTWRNVPGKSDQYSALFIRLINQFLSSNHIFSPVSSAFFSGHWQRANGFSL